MSLPEPLESVPAAGRVQIPVFNPGDSREHVPAFGSFFEFGPLSIGYVEDIWEWPRDEENRIPEEVTAHRPDGGGGRIIPMDSSILALREVSVDAQKVADFICSPESMGPRGFIRLKGTPEQQRQQMWDARHIYLSVRSDEVNGIIEAWEVVAYQHVQANPNPNRPGLRPPKRVQAAMRWREERAEELEEHGIDIPLPYAPTPGQPPPQLPAPVDTAQQERQVAGAVLLGRALERELPLSRGDQKGLVAGDPDVIQEIEERLAAHVADQTAPPPAPSSGKGKRAKGAASPEEEPPASE